MEFALADVASAAEKLVTQDDGVVMRLVANRIDQCDRALAGERAQLGDEIRMLAQLLGVAVAKFIPALWVVMEPLAELGRWRDLLHPLVERGFLSRDSARPQAVDEDARAVLTRGRVVGPLQLDVGGWDLCGHRS